MHICIAAMGLLGSGTSKWLGMQRAPCQILSLPSRNLSPAGMGKKTDKKKEIIQITIVTLQLTLNKITLSLTYNSIFKKGLSCFEKI